MKAEFSARGAISKAVSLTKDNWYILVLMYLAIYLVSNLLSSSVMPALDPTKMRDLDDFMTWFTDNALRIQTSSILSNLVTMLMTVGLVKSLFNIIDGGKPGFESYSLPASTYVHYVLCSIISGFLICIATLFLLLPGLFVGVRLMFAPYYVVDKNMTCTQAIEASWRDTKGNWWHLFFGSILIYAFLLLGFLLLLVGALYTVPIAMLAFAIVYRAIARPGQPAPAVEE